MWSDGDSDFDPKVILQVLLGCVQSKGEWSKYSESGSLFGGSISQSLVLENC